jgi:hypothetical protein
MSPWDPQAEFRSGTRQVQHLSRIDKCLRRHAAPQNAKATEIFGAIDDGDALA